MAFLSNKLLQRDCSDRPLAGWQLWSEPAESAKVVWKDCCSPAVYETDKFKRRRENRWISDIRPLLTQKIRT
jgi:hypothetical protein